MFSLYNSSNKSSNKSSNINSQERNLVEKSLQKREEYTINTENYLLILAIVISCIILGIVYVFSKSFRVYKTLDSLKIYNNYQHLSSYNFSKLGDRKLCDLRVASSYNSTHIGYQMYDYTSEDMLLALLRCGVRYVEFNIFNSEYGSGAIPMVSMGYKEGEWKLCLTDIPLERCINIIAKNAFTIQDGSYGVPNPDDPLFIGLNLNTNSNLKCLDLIADILMDYLGKYFIDPRFSYQNTRDIGDIKMIDLMGKIAIFSSDGYQGSKLEEVVNYCWDNFNNDPKHKMQRIYSGDLNDPDFNPNTLINYNKTGITIIVPHKEGDFWTTNYDPSLAFDYGCQFVAMNYQQIDINMDKYITLFKNKSIITKPTNIHNNT